MTITTTTQTTDHNVVVPSLRTVDMTASRLLEAMTEAGLDDPRWETTGPLVSAAALTLREALGTPARGTCLSAAPVVREADFAAAARPLLSPDVQLTNPEAARDFVRLAVDARLALS